MKIISYIIFILLVFSNLCFASGVRNIQENYQVVYNILDNDGTFVSGETVALKIKKVSTGHWYDFNDSTFKASGWTSKSANLSEDATEDYYYYTYDPPGTETAAEQYLFMVSNANATYKDHQGELVSYQDIGTSDFDYSSNNVTVDDKTGFSLSAAGIDSIWDELQAGHTTASTFGKYLDSEISGITTSISDADKNDIVDKTWDELLSGHTTAGTAGIALSTAALLGDPWAVEVPGSYTGSQAGFLFSYIDAKISTRAQPSDVQIYVGE